MSSHREDDRPDRWRSHPIAGLLLRALALLIPFAVSLACILTLAHVVPRPHGTALIGWYVGICAVSWLALALAQRPLGRLLPLAVLLELALVFPDNAPSRAQLARRAGSTRALRQLLASPQNETVQEAAERVLTLVGALAKHDRKTRGHAERVRALSDLIAERMALPQHGRDRLRWAALLHDIGKLQVSAELLNKDGKPTSHEWDVIRRHPEHGAQIAAPLMEWLEGWGDVIVQHHERWDGGGYPHGLAGAEICLGARIVSVADAYDVMTSTRAYKKPIGRAAALRDLTRCAGSQFDPNVVRAMFAVPSRRLVVAMGPLSWMSGLPFVGQTAVVAQTSTALGAAALTGAAAFAPAVDVSTTPHSTSLSIPARSHVDGGPGANAGPISVADSARSISSAHTGQGRARSSHVAHGQNRQDPTGSTKPTKPRATTSPTPRPTRSHKTTPAGSPTSSPTPTPTRTDSSGPGGGDGGGDGGGGGGGGNSGPGSGTPTPGTDH